MERLIHPRGGLVGFALATMAALLCSLTLLSATPNNAYAETYEVSDLVSLNRAVSGSVDGDVIVLMEDVDITAEGLKFPENKELTFDLNGHKVKAENSERGQIVVNGALTLCDSTDTAKDGSGKGKIYSETPYSSVAQYAIVQVGGSFVMESGLIDSASAFNDPTNQGQFGVMVANVVSDASIAMNGGKIIAGWYAIAGNGTYKTYESVINVNGGLLESTADYAVYHPQKGTLNINGGVVYGAAGGVSMNRGTLNVSGGIITSKGTGSTGNWGDGTGGHDCAALDIKAEYDFVDVSVTGGKFIAEEKTVIIRNADKSSIDIQGGTFTAQGKKFDVSGMYDPAKYYQNDAGTVLPVQQLDPTDPNKGVVVVAPDENVADVPAETVKESAKQANAITKELEDGTTTPKGMNDVDAKEAREVIEQATTDQHTVTTVMLLKAEPRDETSVPDDVSLIEGKKSANESIASLYDLSAAVQFVVTDADNKVISRSNEFPLSETAGKIAFELKVAKNAVEGKAVRVAHVHDGQVNIAAPDAVDATADPATVTVSADKFSTFSILTAGNCTVTFQSNDGPAVDPQTVEYQKTATDPQITRDGYAFKGWYANEDLSGDAYKFDTPVTGDMTLYAKWAKLHTVTFDLCQASQNSISVTVEEGSCVAPQQAPECTGCKFDGWYTAVDGGDQYDFSKPVNSTFTLYAHYSKDENQTQPTQYTVQHVTVTGEGDATVEKVESEQTFPSTAWVLDKTPVIVVQEGSLVPKDIAGYKFDRLSSEVAVGDEILSGSVIKLYYAKDGTQTKALSYIVKHTLGGVEQAEDTHTYTESVWVNDARNQTPIQEGSIGKAYEGYKLDGYYVNDVLEEDLKVGSMVPDGAVVEARYSADFSGVSVDDVTKTYDGDAVVILPVHGILETDDVTYEVGGQAPQGGFVDVEDSTTVTAKVKRGTETWEDTCTVAIAPAPVTITAKSATKVYDGKPLTEPGFVAEGFIGDEGAESVTVEGSQTEVGKSANKATGWTPKANTKASNYSVTFADGTLEVTKAADPQKPTDPQKPDTVTPDNKPIPDKKAPGKAIFAKTNDALPLLPLAAVAGGAALVALGSFALRRRSSK